MPHEHHHEHCDCHSHDCGCGHSHEKTKNKKLDFSLLIISIILFIISFFLPQTPKLVINVIATLLAGYQTFLLGFKSLFKFHFDETLLLTIAVIAAFALGEGFEAVAVTILFNIGQKIEDYAVNSSQRSIDKLSQIQPKTANLISQNGEVKVADIKEIKIGDKILIKAGERVPLDCEILNGTSSFDTSAVTGESIPADLSIGDELLSGEINLTGAVECQVTKDHKSSTASQIIELVKMSSQKKSETQKFVTRFAEVYTPVIMILAILVAVVPPLLNLGDFNSWIYKALVFLVASCPCAIVISIPLAFFSSIGKASKFGIFIKGSRDIEALAMTDKFVFDKTGTLTSGEFSVTKITPVGVTEQELLKLTATAESYSNHPIAKAVVKHAGNFNKLPCENATEISGKGIEVEIDGKKIACGNRALMKDNGVTVPDNIIGSVFVCQDKTFIGAIEVEDTLRPDTPEILKSLKNPVMLTGDNRENAKKIADKCNIKEYYSSLLPQDKLNKVKELQNKGHKIAFVGDGINDAPVISQSNVGIAVGKATDIVSNAADIVLTGSSLNQLTKAVRLSQKTMKTVKFNFAFAISVKALVLILDIIGFSNMWLAVIADVGVTIIATLIATRLLYTKL